MQCPGSFWCLSLSDVTKIVNDVSSAVAAIAVVAATILGANALGFWQDKRNLRKRLRHAERTLIAVRRARMTLKHVRSTHVSPEEEGLARIKLNELRKKREYFTIEYYHIDAMVHLNRLMEKKEYVDAIEKYALVTDISLGDDVKNALNVVSDGFKKILNSANFIISFGEEGKDQVRYLGVLKEGFSKDTEKVFENVYDKIDVIESICKDILKSKD